MKLFGILRKPNRLDELADPTNKTPFWSDVHKQIKILHSFGIFYVITFCLSVCLSSVFLGLPQIFGENEAALFRARILMCLICFNIISNFLLILHHGRKSYYGPGCAGGLPFKSFQNYSESEHDKSDWHLCQHCNIQVPPRTRHCSICQCCVLKKDHHCFFTGTCIGFYNQKYFIIFAFYGIIGGSWGLYNLGSYLSETYAPIFGMQVYKYLLPYCLATVLIGWESFSTILLILLLYLHITSTATSVYYFLWQIYIIHRGQTSYELMKRQKLYRAGFAENMRSVFGPYWVMSFIVPTPALLNEGDGKTWEKEGKSQ